MKIGLLECDHVMPELRQFGGDYRDMFPALLPTLEFVPYDVCMGQFPAGVDDCEAWLCTGSRYSVYDGEGWIQELKDFVRELHRSEKKFVGICFGHQLLGEALGGRVRKSERGWCVGVHTFSALQVEDWMAPPLDSLNLLMSCQDQVVVLPEGATLLASAPDCEVGMFRVGSHMLGIQAHPEFPLAYARALMEMRLSRIGEETVQRSRATFGLPVHAPAVAEWMLQFLNYRP
jgi:GMP synthase-like glutamine amidotransferase